MKQFAVFYKLVQINVIVAVLAILLVSCSNTKRLAPAKHGMQEIQPNLFVDKQMSVAQRGQLVYDLNRARGSIREFFGSMKSNPRILACVTEACFQSFDNRQHKARAKAFGDNTILMSPRGLNSVILTHEMAHIELHKRIGNRRAWSKLPMWFDEGLATLVCKDPRYNELTWLETTNHGRNAPNLDELVTDSQWLNAVKQNKRAYGTAKREVLAWYQNVGSRGLHELIRRLQQGESFAKAYGGNISYANSHKNNARSFTQF